MSSRAARFLDPGSDARWHCFVANARAQACKNTTQHDNVTESLPYLQLSLHKKTIAAFASSINLAK